MYVSKIYKKSIIRHSGHLKWDADQVRPVEPSVIVYLKRLSQGKPPFFDGLLILTSLTTKQRSLDGQGCNWKLFSKSGGGLEKNLNILMLFCFRFVLCRLTISLINECGVTGYELPSCPDPGTKLAYLALNVNRVSSSFYPRNARSHLLE